MYLLILIDTPPSPEKDEQLFCVVLGAQMKGNEMENGRGPYAARPSNTYKPHRCLYHIQRNVTGGDLQGTKATQQKSVVLYFLTALHQQNRRREKRLDCLLLFIVCFCKPGKSCFNAFAYTAPNCLPFASSVRSGLWHVNIVN